MSAGKKRPNSADLEADRAIIVALQDVADYAPTNPACSVPALRELMAILDRCEETELRADRAHKVSREQLIEAACNVHSAVLETKIQVMAQFGSDSPVLHAVGLKQRSERKRRARRAPVAQ
jgi:hypothetical protein